MKVYNAVYLLFTNTKGNLEEVFKFDELDEGRYSKTDYGYFKTDGYFSKRLEDDIDTNDYMYHVRNEKFFDHELSEEELKQLKLNMKKESVSALENKKNKIIDDISEKISFIVNNE